MTGTFDIKTGREMDGRWIGWKEVIYHRTLTEKLRNVDFVLCLFSFLFSFK